MGWGKKRSRFCLGCCNLRANILKHKTSGKLCKHFKSFHQHAANAERDGKSQKDRHQERCMRKRARERGRKWDGESVRLTEICISFDAQPKASLKQLSSYFLHLDLWRFSCHRDVSVSPGPVYISHSAAEFGLCHAAAVATQVGKCQNTEICPPKLGVSNWQETILSICENRIL